MILTRILRPEAYGIITILMSIVFVVSMLADIGVTVFIIRDKNGEEPKYFNTAWTIRFCRSMLNGIIVFVLASLISSSLYHAPSLTNPLRVMSLWFVISALESMSFPMAIRRKQSNICVYSELIATLISTIFTVAYCTYSRDYWGMVYGILLNRLLTTIISYKIYPEFRPRFQLDRAVAKEIFGFSKFAMPSSMLTLAMSQFDKVVFLRLFDLRLLGVYGLANNIAIPVEALITKISQTVLYPRCAHNFRERQDTFSLKYYTDNVKLFASILFVPAAIGGAAHFLISTLYDPRYAQAGAILQAFMVRAALLSFCAPAEDMLFAAGETQVFLVGTAYRTASTFVASLLGYYLFGLLGFAYGIALSGLPPLTYYLWLQRKKDMLIAKYEIYKIAFSCVVAISAYLTSNVILTFLPSVRIKL